MIPSSHYYWVGGPPKVLVILSVKFSKLCVVMLGAWRDLKFAKIRQRILYTCAAKLRALLRLGWRYTYLFECENAGKMLPLKLLGLASTWEPKLPDIKGLFPEQLLAG